MYFVISALPSKRRKSSSTPSSPHPVLLEHVNVSSSFIYTGVSHNSRKQSVNVRISCIKVQFFLSFFVENNYTVISIITYASVMLVIRLTKLELVSKTADRRSNL